MSKELNQGTNNQQALKWYKYWLPYAGLFITWLSVHQVISFFVRLHTVDTENVRIAERMAAERGVGIVFAMNHTNRLLDPFFVTATSTPHYPSYPMFYVTGKMDMYQKYSSGFSKLIDNDFLFKALGSQYIRSGKRDYSKSLERHIKLLKAGQSVCIFPEGRLTPDGKIGMAHGGVGYLAIETGSVVVPVHTTNAYKMSFWDFILRKRRVTVHYGKPMCADNFRPLELGEKNKYQQYADIILSRVVSTVQFANL